ncbi:protein disulfide-isomerase tigA precursor [Metarhizium album ARSEF 1941]|uniref:protein disulfide-isomerase n=1 Tax=Metarhizium album (strain ARSEF 1941) TaxID=1081103 RepID=A0A0B2WP26_METAS|nr:protein disulfide-isomerase tigA precursor [Metarhizium album ARSEF 1941]KHN95748.1 protein disulfide-isomerase tigA precursor [Metarhizium album ARSEF 1941]
MVLIKSFVLAAVAAVATARSAVMDLTHSNFDKVVLKSGIPTLVEFFAPWCGHCKSLAPTYEELALALEHAKDKVQIAKVDADSERELGKRFGIQGFPTLKYFDGKSDKPEEYKSGRDLESLTKFLTEKAGVKAKKKLEMPSKVVMLTDSSFAEVIGSDKNVLVAFTAPWCGHCKNLAPTWESLAADFANEANVVIAKVDAEAPHSKAVATEQGVTSYPTIKWFPAGSKKAESYDGARSEDAFVEFINKEAGTHRVAGGGLDRDAGTIPVLDSLVAKFIEGAKLEDTAAEVKSAIEKLGDDAKYAYAKYYIRVFDKLNKSDNFVAMELSRLEGILENGGLGPSKRDEVQSRTNVLRRFVKKAAEKAEEIRDEL